MQNIFDNIQWKMVIENRLISPFTTRSIQLIFSLSQDVDKKLPTFRAGLPVDLI